MDKLSSPGSAHINFTMGALVAVQGMHGFVTIKSTPALVIGCLVGSMYVGAGLLIRANHCEWGHGLAIATSLALSARMGHYVYKWVSIDPQLYFSVHISPLCTTLMRPVSFLGTWLLPLPAAGPACGCLAGPWQSRPPSPGYTTPSSCARTWLEEGVKRNVTRGTATASNTVWSNVQ